jgi:putative membrane protein
MAEPPAQGHGTAASRRSSRERARLVAVAILVSAATIFALVNLDEVSVDLVFGTARMPLIVVIVGCLLIGAAVGAVLGRRSGRPG